jgi:hypothetical protein
MENVGHLKTLIFVFKRILLFIEIILSKAPIRSCTGPKVIRDSNPVKSSDYQIRSKKMTKQVEKQKMLREIANDNLTPKKHDFKIQNEIHSAIRNDEDYDDWEYGTEPLYESKNK